MYILSIHNVSVSNVCECFMFRAFLKSLGSVVTVEGLVKEQSLEKSECYQMTSWCVSPSPLPAANLSSLLPSSPSKHCHDSVYNSKLLPSSKKVIHIAY